MNRLAAAACGLVLTAASLLAQVTGTEVPEFASLDRDIPALMAAAHVPGGAIALVKDGRLVFARGYGLADIAHREAFQPNALCRIGSISKTVTAAAILKLYEAASLILDTKVFPDVLTQLQPASGASVDPRLHEISVRHLLHHTGGHGRDSGLDPLNYGTVIAAAEAFHSGMPPSSETVIRYAMGLPLDFDPGAEYSYSNYGFLVLARVVERIAGQAYDDYVRQQVLAPIGIRRMMLGKTLPEDRQPGEVHYYDTPRAPLEFSLLPNVRRLLPSPYANFEVMGSDGSGRWIASAIDLVRFAVHLECSRIPCLLQPDTFQLMLEKPDPFVTPDPAGVSWYGMGASAAPWKGSLVWAHGGFYPGAVAFVESLGNGYIYAYVFNATPDNTTFQDAVSQKLFDLDAAAQHWPAHDLFPQYYPEN